MTGLCCQVRPKIELTPDASVTAIGIVAAYREIEQAEWKAVIYPLPKNAWTLGIKKCGQGKTNKIRS